MKKSIITIVIVSLLIQTISFLGLLSLEKRYGDFDKNSYSVPVVGQDSPDFYVLSKNIRSNNSFSLDGKKLETFRTPGYPFFLALTGGGTASLVFSMLITVVSSIFVFLIALYFVREKYAAMTAIVYTVSPSVVFHGVVFLSDGLFTMCTLIAVYLVFFLIRHWFLGGLLLGYATLIRPIGMFLPIIVIIFLLCRKIYKPIVLFLLGFSIIVFPWMLRNYEYSGHFSISSISTYNMALYNLPDFLDDTKYSDKIADLEKTYDLRSLRNSDILKDFVAKEMEGKLFAYGIFHLSAIPKFFISSPIRYISINTGNIFNDVIGIGRPLGEINILNVDRLYMFLLTALALCSIYFGYKRGSVLEVIVLVSLIGYFAVLTGPVAIPRYRLPVDGYILIMAVFSLVSMIEFYLCRNFSR